MITKMRKACNIAAKALRAGLEAVKVGITSEEVDAVCQKVIIDNGAYPSGIFFMGFPKTACISVNEVACHGVPDTRPLEDGDMLNIDVTCYVDGVFGDNSDMAVAGTPHPEIARLISATRESLQAGI
jgi:methionyl aminopeptidase